MKTGLQQHASILNDGQVFHFGGCPNPDVQIQTDNIYTTAPQPPCIFRLIKLINHNDLNMNLHIFTIFRIESWSEQKGSKTVMDFPAIPTPGFLDRFKFYLHEFTYMVPIFWMKNVFRIDNPLILRRSGMAGKLSPPSFGKFHSGDHIGFSIILFICWPPMSVTLNFFSINVLCVYPFVFFVIYN